MQRLYTLDTRGGKRRMIYFTADEHYYHANIISNRFRDTRPFNTVDEMNRTIIKHHNEIVTKDDVTYHLGDFSFSKHWQDMRHILGKLNGRHILVLGNHDLFKPFEYVEVGFESIHTSIHFLEDSWDEIHPILIHDPAVAGVFKDKRVIHGHTHGLGLTLASNTYCVSVELHDYYPVPITKINFGGN
jgi:calcineurin-like phosphoesterase family protein